MNSPRFPVPDGTPSRPRATVATIDGEIPANPTQVADEDSGSPPNGLAVLGAAEKPLAPASKGGGKLKFARDTGFHKEVKRRVFGYFKRTGLSTRDSPRMYIKAVALLLWFGASYT